MKLLVGIVLLFSLNGYAGADRLISEEIFEELPAPAQGKITEWYEAFLNGRNGNRVKARTDADFHLKRMLDSAVYKNAPPEVQESMALTLTWQAVLSYPMTTIERTALKPQMEALKQQIIAIIGKDEKRLARFNEAWDDPVKVTLTTPGGYAAVNADPTRIRQKLLVEWFMLYDPSKGALGVPDIVLSEIRGVQKYTLMPSVVATSTIGVGAMTLMGGLNSLKAAEPNSPEVNQSEQKGDTSAGAPQPFILTSPQNQQSNTNSVVKPAQ